jgi:hypothetical protein
MLRQQLETMINSTTYPQVVDIDSVKEFQKNGDIEIIYRHFPGKKIIETPFTTDKINFNYSDKPQIVVKFRNASVIDSVMQNFFTTIPLIGGPIEGIFVPKKKYIRNNFPKTSFFEQIFNFFRSVPKPEIVFRLSGMGISCMNVICIDTNCVQNQKAQFLRNNLVKIADYLSTNVAFDIVTERSNEYHSSSTTQYDSYHIQSSVETVLKNILSLICCRIIEIERLLIGDCTNGSNKYDELHLYDNLLFQIVIKLEEYDFMYNYLKYIGNVAYYPNNTGFTEYMVERFKTNLQSNVTDEKMDLLFACVNANDFITQLFSPLFSNYPNEELITNYYNHLQNYHLNENFDNCIESLFKENNIKISIVKVRTNKVTQSKITTTLFDGKIDAILTSHPFDLNEFKNCASRLSAEKFNEVFILSAQTFLERVQVLYNIAQNGIQNLDNDTISTAHDCAHVSSKQDICNFLISLIKNE